MEEFFVDVCEQLSAHIWLQALLVVVGTCFLEDAARCGVGLLVSAGQIEWGLAFVSMTIGGMVGDIGLYVIGRYASIFLYRHRLIDRERLTWVNDQFKRHAFKAVMLARFIPGARTVVYASAGIVRYPMPRFTFFLFVAAVVQSLLFLQVANFIGDHLLPYLRDTRLRLAVFGLIVLALVWGHHILARRNKRRAKQSADEKAPLRSPSTPSL